VQARLLARAGEKTCQIQFASRECLITMQFRINPAPNALLNGFALIAFASLASVACVVESDGNDGDDTDSLDSYIQNQEQEWKKEPWNPGSGGGTRPWNDLKCIGKTVTDANRSSCDAFCNDGGLCSAVCSHVWNEATGGCALQAKCMDCAEIPPVETETPGGNGGGGGLR
jgi:hypothetical protein